MNYALHVSTVVHVHDLHGTGPKPARDLVQTNLSQTFRFKVSTVYVVGMRYEHLMRERVLHDDSADIVPNPILLQSGVAHHGSDML